jgi:hypothetical protein
MSGRIVNRLLQALAHLVEGIMRDPRAFHMSGPEFLESYDNQGNSISVKRIL